jgi:hypothetical protein
MEIGGKEIGEFLIRESKKRNITIPELMSYFTGNEEEFVKLLKKSGVVSPKFSKIYEHSELENITHQLFKTQKLNNIGRSIINSDFPSGEVEIWESKGVQYIVKVDDLPKFEGKNPKAYVSQIKNINLLIGLIQEQQYDNTIKEAKCEFMLSYYAERRGYTKEEIKKGGYIFDELRRDLFTGAYTTYKVDSIIIEGKKYIAHGIPNFYILYEPKDPGNSWRVTFNNPYINWITDILNGKAKQYFIKDPKAIEDRNTTERPYLFLFYMQLVKRKRANLYTAPIKVKSLLEDMKLPEDILARPQECFKVLKECLIYFHTHYEPIPEIESFNLYNDFHKTETLRMPLSISEAFENYPYEDFKGLIAATGLKDIRDAYISFKSYPVSKHRKYKLFILTEEDKLLIEEIMAWAENWEEYEEGNEIPFTEEERYKFLSDCIRYLGHEKVTDSFSEEMGREKEGYKGKGYHVDDPIGYFTKRLPELLKEDKDTIG